MAKDRYTIYSKHLVQKFGEKVYKLPLNLPGSCPNRDGTIGSGGCTFCDETGAGFQCLPNSYAIAMQVEKNKAYFRKRFHAHKFIAYFQAFTNTYIPFTQFKANILAACQEDIVGISISTRPDCIHDSYLDFLAEIKEKNQIDINIELGLQTVNYHTLLKINRGHTLAEFVDAVLRIQRRNFDICTHLILNLPGDTILDVVENAKLLSALQIQYVKLHSLYIVDNTPLGEMFKKNLFTIISLEEYIERVITFLAYVDPHMVIQRLVGKGPTEHLLFSNWGISWWKIKQSIEEQLEFRDIQQGCKCNYLNGSALPCSWKDENLK